MDVNPIVLLPLLFTLVLALVTRQTLLALLGGIVTGALLIQDFSIVTTITYLTTTASELFYADNQWQQWHLNVLAAMLMLGMMTRLFSVSGAVDSFSQWLYRRITSGRQARLGVVLLGYLVFIDGIFSCLAVGHVCRPLTRRYQISAPQLAYLVDSNASPLCSLLPISSWGPYVMALLASISFMTLPPLSAFIVVAQGNFYAMLTLLMALWLAYTGQGFQRGQQPAIAIDDTELGGSSSLGPWLLLLPMLTLLAGAVGFTLVSGMNAAPDGGITQWLASADIGVAMRNACLLALIVTLVSMVKARSGVTVMLNGVVGGIGMMLFAIGILLSTWMIGKVIDDLNVASLLAYWAEQYLSQTLLVPGLFVLCAMMAFSTGSSWGTFAIMIPIGAQISHQLDISMLLPALSAVMAGSVFGDHCSPISDTSVISASSSGCTPYEHVITQIPLALVTASGALMGFYLLNVGWSYLAAGAVAVALGFSLLQLLLWQRQRRLKSAMV
ncbi:Na+/H+ antiporter NhaC family protein [Shewanella sp. NIFS-20-20]|uniref:Na+/H+ antiporter NhaC family protein n=1 Tax=Shewanella sp. NIFS-20-20 TaxID=2853806 RepID=UPI001C476610|nr:Na+/H+ antiporter NhaC family protein [Shewanella sp. NIFS-20-20]MBV7315663.1 sodium:proton antiporter [Shewanella sp. NIFS-20-20]